MTGMDAVEKQVAAFNARDLDAFVACYAREAVIEDDSATLRVGALTVACASVPE